MDIRCESRPAWRIARLRPVAISGASPHSSICDIHRTGDLEDTRWRTWSRIAPFAPPNAGVNQAWLPSPDSAPLARRVESAGLLWGNPPRARPGPLIERPPIEWLGGARRRQSVTRRSEKDAFCRGVAVQPAKNARVGIRMIPFGGPYLREVWASGQLERQHWENRQHETAAAREPRRPKK